MGAIAKKIFLQSPWSGPPTYIGWSRSIFLKMKIKTSPLPSHSMPPLLCSPAGTRALCWAPPTPAPSAAPTPSNVPSPFAAPSPFTAPMPSRPRPHRNGASGAGTGMGVAEEHGRQHRGHGRGGGQWCERGCRRGPVDEQGVGVRRWARERRHGAGEVLRGCGGTGKGQWP